MGTRLYASVSCRFVFVDSLEYLKIHSFSSSLYLQHDMPSSRPATSSTVPFTPKPRKRASSSKFTFTDKELNQVHFRLFAQ